MNKLNRSRNYYPSRGGMYLKDGNTYIKVFMSRNYYPSRGGMYLKKIALKKVGEFVSKLLSLTWRDVYMGEIEMEFLKKIVSKLLSLTWRDVSSW